MTDEYLSFRDAAQLEGIKVNSQHETSGRPVVVPESTPVGPGRPLSLKIRSVYPGRQHKKAVLVTSSIRNPSLPDAEPWAIHWVFDPVAPGQLLKPKPAQPGSNVLFYSPAVLDSSLNVAVRLAFDDFDVARYKKWIALAAKFGKIPAFTIGAVATGGAAGAIATQGLVYGAERASNLLLEQVDKKIDGHNDWYSTWTLNIEEAGIALAQSGWVLFYGDGPVSPDFIGEHNLFSASGYFKVDPMSGTLRIANHPDQVVLGDEPYVLCYLDGREERSLSSWSRTAASAAVAQRFLGQGQDGMSAIGELLEVYNDIMMSRQLADVEGELADPDITEVARSSLSGKRKALLKNIYDDDLRKMLSG